MNNLLIIYPHWHPSNLAGVHRPRLIGNFLPEFGWKPVILTVKAEYFEEIPDENFEKTFRDHYEVHRVDAMPIHSFRILGDIGLRAFWKLFIEAKKIIREQKIDFIWIPVPSYYPALIGRMLHGIYKIPYGVDYIDPWVRDAKIYGSWGLRMKLSLFVARFLEPIAVKNAALISGVSRAYYNNVLARNFKNRQIVDVAMPYGFDFEDHTVKLNIKMPWSELEDCYPIIYAGAYLPNAKYFFELLFEAIKELVEQNRFSKKIKLYFIGTGLYPGQTIKELAEKIGVADFVIEDRERKPFLYILNYLNNAKGVLVVGSTSPHYTASKIFQSLLSKKPVFAIFHQESTVTNILKEVEADEFLITYDKNKQKDSLIEEIKRKLIQFIDDEQLWLPELDKLDKYSARASASKLVAGINQVLKQ